MRQECGHSEKRSDNCFEIFLFGKTHSVKFIHLSYFLSVQFGGIKHSHFVLPLPPSIHGTLSYSENWNSVPIKHSNKPEVVTTDRSKGKGFYRAHVEGRQGNHLIGYSLNESTIWDSLVSYLWFVLLWFSSLSLKAFIGKAAKTL